MQEGNKKLVVQVVIFVVAFAIAFFGTRYVMSNFKSADSELKKEALKLNKDCPKLIDKETRLDSANTFDSTFEYHFSLINFSKGDANLDVDGVKKMIRASAQENFDTNPEMKSFRDKNVSLKYSYKDKTGKDLFDFTIKASNK